MIPSAHPIPSNQRRRPGQTLLLKAGVGMIAIGLAVPCISVGTAVGAIEFIATVYTFSARSTDGR